MVPRPDHADGSRSLTAWAHHDPDPGVSDGKRGRVWSDSDRVEVGRSRRQAEADETAPTGPRQRQDAVPDFQAEDHTRPYELFDPSRAERRLTRESVGELAVRLRRDDHRDPYDLLATLAFEVAHAKQLTRESIAETVADLGHEVAAINRNHAIAGKLALLLLGGLVSAVIYVANTISSASELRGSNAVRIQTLEQTVRDLQVELRDAMSRRKESQ